MKSKIKEVLCIIAMMILFAIASIIGGLLGRKVAEKEIQRLYKEGVIENVQEESFSETK